jgi:NADH:ubiquinone oxidoreductase subunit C
MKFIEYYQINKSFVNAVLINSPVVNRIEHDLYKATSLVNLHSATKKDLSLVLNKLVIVNSSVLWRSIFLNDLVCVDLLTQLKKSEYSDGFRFMLKYCFTSLTSKNSINFYIKLRKDNKIFSLENITKSCVWLQREVWDMYGIFFQGTTDLRRILTDYGFNSFPLRVDFPVLGYVELYYDIEMAELLYKKIDTAQENRFFGYNENFFWF